MMSNEIQQPANQYFVKIIETETGKVAKIMGPLSKRRAEKVENGALINLNHAKFHTSIVEKCMTDIEDTVGHE